MMNEFKLASRKIGLSFADYEKVLARILAEYKRNDNRPGVDWVDIISEILEEENLINKYVKQ